MLDQIYKVVFPYRAEDKTGILEILEAGIYHGEITSEEYQRIKEMLK